MWEGSSSGNNVRPLPIPSFILSPFSSLLLLPFPFPSHFPVFNPLFLPFSFLPLVSPSYYFPSPSIPLFSHPFLPFSSPPPSYLYSLPLCFPSSFPSLFFPPLLPLLSPFLPFHSPPYNPLIFLPLILLSLSSPFLTHVFTSPLSFSFYPSLSSTLHSYPFLLLFATSLHFSFSLSFPSPSISV